MRTQLIGGLVDILKYNLNRRAERVRVFELGRVFFPDPSIEEGPWTVKGVRQPQHIAGLAYGDADDKQWGKPARRVDFYDVKGDLERLAAPMKLRFVKEAFPALHPGRSAAVYLGSKRIGFIGELHPKAAQAYELPPCPGGFRSRGAGTSGSSASELRTGEQVPVRYPRLGRRRACGNGSREAL